MSKLAFEYKDTEIGAIEVSHEAKITIDGKELPAAAVEYLISYGLRQSLQDSYASAKSDVEVAKGLFAKRLDKIMSGDFSRSERTKGQAMSQEERIRLEMAQEHMQRFNAPQWKALPKAKDDAEGRASKIAEYADRYATDKVMVAMIKAKTDFLAAMAGIGSDL